MLSVCHSSVHATFVHGPSFHRQPLQQHKILLMLTSLTFPLLHTTCNWCVSGIAVRLVPFGQFASLFVKWNVCLKWTHLSGFAFSVVQCSFAATKKDSGVSATHVPFFTNLTMACLTWPVQALHGPLPCLMP